ncbi:MAG: prepilin-type N-terminal cleavage/methylation domain-containing protein [Clostridium sp.]
MYKRAEGFTLIETIISISILMIIFTTAVSISAMKDNIENEAKKDSDIYEIQNLMTFSKLKCKKDNAAGKVLINKKTSELSFYSGTGDESPFKKIILSNDSDYIGSSSNIFVSNKGRVLNGATIYVKNDNQIDSITIGVGVDTIRIKDE